jgi:hypothetical protein
LLPELAGDKAADRSPWVLSEYHSNFQNTSSFMLRSDDHKYVAYAGYEPQLFNLVDDPDEMRNLIDMSGDLADRMDVKLREIVDYEQVAQKVRDYNKASFIRWRTETDSQAYEQAMAAFFKGWGLEQETKIAEWLGER